MIVGFIKTFGVRRPVAALAFSTNAVSSRCHSKALTGQRTPKKTKRANRKAYDWPLNLEKLSRRKTFGARVVALHHLNGDSPVDLATATNSPGLKTHARASATFPFD
jgi:hypothetical protein